MKRGIFPALFAASDLSEYPTASEVEPFHGYSQLGGYCYSVNLSGWILSNHFAAHREPFGWVVLHLKTGLAFVHCPCLKDCRIVVREIEAASDQWGRKSLRFGGYGSKALHKAVDVRGTIGPIIERLRLAGIVT